MRNHFSQWLVGALAVLASPSALHAQTIIPYTNGQNNAAPIVLVDPAGTILDVIVGAAEQSGPISGAAGVLTKRGAGILTLTGTNSYASATRIRAGELFADAPDALANFSNFTVDSSATLRVGDGLGFFPAIGSLAGGGRLIIGDATILTLGLNDDDTTFSGIISGLGSLEKTGLGTQTLTGKGSSIGGDLTLCNCGGGLTIAGGTFVAGGNVEAIESTLAVTLGGVLEQMASPSSGGMFDVDSSSVLVDGAGSRILATGFTVIEAFSDDASLTIRNGGVFESRNTALIASAAGAASSVLVTGAGSTWNVDNGLFLLGCPCGPATLTIADGGLVNSTGFTVISQNSTLNLGAGGLAGSIVTKEIQNDGAIKANFTDTSTLATIISGFGTLTKDGAGKLILSGKSTYTGDTTVDGGTLSVNGSIGDSIVTVNDGGVLGGNGIVGTTVLNNGGALAPGNSVGTLTVNNRLTFASGSTYNVEVSTTADRTNVVAGAGPGNAVLTGGAVEAAFLPTGTLQKRYAILNAAGGLGGTQFTGVTDNAPGIATSLSYDPDNVYLDNRVVLNQLPGLTINQQNVAGALTDSFDRNGTLPLAFATLDPAGLALASGELATGAMQSGFESSERFLDVISGRFVFADGPGDGGPAAAALAGQSASAVAAYDGNAADAGASGAYATLLDRQASHAVAPAFDNRWKMWGAAYGGASDVDGDAAVVGSHDLSTDVFGFAAGTGWRLGDVAFGAALGGGHANFDLDGGLGSGDEGLFNAGIHGRAEFGAAYLLGALAYGYHDVSTSRLVGAETLEANYSAHSFSGRAEAGYRFDTPTVGLTPYAAFQGTSLSIPSYSETASGTGTFALDYDGRTATAARGELGIRLDKTFVLDDAMLMTLTGRAAWAHSSDGNRSITAGFQALPGTSFSVFGATPDRDSALLDLGAKLAWQNGVAAAVSFQSQLSRSSQSYAGFAKLSFKW